jgi:regulator of sigma D
MLTDQHNSLKKELDKTRNFAFETTPDGKKIIKSLDRFRVLLVEHVSIENKEFYPKVLKKMAEKGMPLENTELFIDEMNSLEKEIVDFMKKYGDAAAISAKIVVFRSELEFVISSLAIRITSDEQGVFLYW